MITGQRSGDQQRVFARLKERVNLAKETRVKSTGRPLELLFRVTSNEDSRFFSLPSSLGTRPTRKRGAAASPLATLIREFFFFHGVFRDVNIVDEDCGPIPGIGTSLTRKKTPISFYSIGNEKPRKAMANDEAPVARDGLAYKEAKRMADARSSRLASTRLDSTLNSLQSLDKKQSAAFLAVRCIGVQRWGFLSFRATVTFQPYPTIEPYHRLLQRGFSSPLASQPNINSTRLSSPAVYVANASLLETERERERESQLRRNERISVLI